MGQKEHQVPKGHVSAEEKYFTHYLDELLIAGYIEKYIWQPTPWILSDSLIFEFDKILKTKTKKVKQKILATHQYRTDYLIEWAEKARGVLFLGVEDRENLKKVSFFAQNNISYVEIKPAFDVHNMQREFSINQKWVWQKYKIYVQKITISNERKGIFAKTFTPKAYLQTPTGKLKKLRYSPLTLKQFIEGDAL